MEDIDKGTKGSKRVITEKKKSDGQKCQDLDKMVEREGVGEVSACIEEVGSRKKRVEKYVRRKNCNADFANERSVLPHRIKDHKKEPPDYDYRKEDSRRTETIGGDDTRTRGGDETRMSRNKEEKKTDRLLQWRRRWRKQIQSSARIERSKEDPQKYTSHGKRQPDLTTNENEDKSGRNGVAKQQAEAKSKEEKMTENSTSLRF